MRVKELLNKLIDAVAAVSEQLVGQEGKLMTPVLGLCIRIGHDRQVIYQLLQTLFLLETVKKVKKHRLD